MPRRRINSVTGCRVKGRSGFGERKPSWARPAVILTGLSPSAARVRRRSQRSGSERKCAVRRMGRVVRPAVVPPPTHSIVMGRRARTPSARTMTRWTICRIISCRSATVVVGACQSAGICCASCWMASRGACESAWDGVCNKRGSSSCSGRCAVSVSAQSLASCRATQRGSGSTNR